MGSILNVPSPPQSRVTPEETALFFCTVACIIQGRVLIYVIQICSTDLRGHHEKYYHLFYIQFHRFLFGQILGAFFDIIVRCLCMPSTLSYGSLKERLVLALPHQPIPHFAYHTQPPLYAFFIIIPFCMVPTSLRRSSGDSNFSLSRNTT